jgi:hypothetical protein
MLKRVAPSILRSGKVRVPPPRAATPLAGAQALHYFSKPATIPAGGRVFTVRTGSRDAPFREFCDKGLA